MRELAVKMLTFQVKVAQKESIINCAVVFQFHEISSSQLE